MHVVREQVGFIFESVTGLVRSMKKLDKLVLSAFLGPFLMTFLVVVFILLTQHMLKYFDDIIGKGLGGDVIGQLLFYFAIFMTPVALPLAVLLSSLIAFGNLGEHFELTAIKASGVSLIRTLQPIFFFVILLTGVAFYANNNLVPKAALEAYSLLYDIKQKKPALDLREGSFYTGINDISIKVNKKYPDGITLKDVIVYDHRKNDGNKEVTVADSGKMYTILNERYLKFELFRGYNYTEGSSSERELAGQKGNSGAESLSRTKFDKTQVVFDLSSFQLERTDKKWFQGNRIMRNLSELNHDMDSVRDQIYGQRLNYYSYKPSYFSYYGKMDSLILPRDVYDYRKRRDSLANLPRDPNPVKTDIQPTVTPVAQPSVSPPPAPTTTTQVKPAVQSAPTKKVASTPKPRSEMRRSVPKKAVVAKAQSKKKVTAPVVAKKTKPEPEPEKSIKRINRDSLRLIRLDSVFSMTPNREVAQGAANMARQVKSQVQNSNTGVDNYQKELIAFDIQWHKILASSLACVAMFLIGAPLGSIIKRGGLGVPFLISILFFIIYYVLTMQGEKLAKQGTVSAGFGVWMADFILLVAGVFFLRQARRDARLFEADFYSVALDKIKRWFAQRKTSSMVSVK